MSMNDPIRQFQDDARRQLAHVLHKAEALRPILKSCEEAITRSDTEASISISNGPNGMPQVRIMLIINSLKDTVPLFRELAKEGLRTNKEHTHQDQKAFELMALRRYDLGPDLAVIAVLFTDPSDDKKQCRLVQTGVREVPTYEMQCDE